MIENKKTYKSIGEVAKILNLFDKKTGKIATHTIRFWEKQFKQIRPTIFSGKRRYYDEKNIEILKKIQFLLKKEGLTIKGVKKYLNHMNSKLDAINNKTINTKTIKTKINKISNLVKNLREDG